MNNYHYEIDCMEDDIANTKDSIGKAIVDLYELNKFLKQSERSLKVLLDLQAECDIKVAKGTNNANGN